MKKIMTLMVLVLALSLVSVFAAPGEVWIEPASQTKYTGDTFILTVNAYPTESVSTVNLQLSFDKDKLQVNSMGVVGIKPELGWTIGKKEFDNVAGKINFQAYSFTNKLSAQELTVLTLTLQVKNGVSGDVAVNVNTAEMKLGTTNYLSGTKTGAVITIPTPAQQPVCDQQNLGLCTTENSCLGLGGYWYEQKCNVQPQATPLVIECTDPDITYKPTNIKKNYLLYNTLQVSSLSVKSKVAGIYGGAGSDIGIVPEDSCVDGDTITEYFCKNATHYSWSSNKCSVKLPGTTCINGACVSGTPAKETNCGDGADEDIDGLMDCDDTLDCPDKQASCGVGKYCSDTKCIFNTVEGNYNGKGKIDKEDIQAIKSNPSGFWNYAGKSIQKLNQYIKKMSDNWKK